tara:strand:- start:492 stop:833 length:342 start_codon:yes stop_codon:yes gene_type:complete
LGLLLLPELALAIRFVLVNIALGELDGSGRPAEHDCGMDKCRSRELRRKWKIQKECLTCRKRVFDLSEKSDWVGIWYTVDVSVAWTRGEVRTGREEVKSFVYTCNQTIRERVI